MKRDSQAVDEREESAAPSSSVLDDDVIDDVLGDIVIHDVSCRCSTP